MVTQLLDQALGVFVELSGELQLVFENHLKNLVWVVRHEGWSAIKQLEYHNTQRVPVDWLRVTLVVDDFGSDVLWGPTECVCPFALQHFLDEAEICKLAVPVRANHNVFGLEISIDKAL
jgi:hypothetical protein